MKAADVRVAAADLLVSQANLAKACICSSIDGIVLDQDVDVGQTPGQRSIWLLENDTPRKVQIAIGPSDGAVTQIVAHDADEGANAITDLQVQQ